MEKLNMQSGNVVQRNIDALAALFHNCLTERQIQIGGGKMRVERAIDFDKLRQELGDVLVEGNEERYQFTWPNKRDANRLANSRISATLRPVREDSVDFDTTQNLYIEGDNLDVLKLLRETYLGKVKMIYIDPPYNTGNDFVYEDDFAQTSDEYLANSGQYDEQGNRLVANTESNGRFHTDWLNMIYPRLKVARDLLADDGVIFISIDDNEQENLKKVCNEIFGNDFVELYIWDVREPGTLPKTAKNTVRKEHEYLVACFKSKKLLSKYRSQKYINADWTNPDNDPRGPWMSANISRGSEGSTGGSKSYIITNPAGISFDRDWAVSEEEYKQLLADNRIFFADNGRGVPRKKIFKTDYVESIQSSLFEGLKSSQSAATLIKSLLGAKCFDFPKPVELILRMLQISTRKDSMVLDFFSGSATTAHAVMQLNAEDGGNRKFIMVQLPEVTDEKSEARKAGYANICEIGKERIRRTGKKIKAEHPEAKDLDIGFRVLRLDSSNMEDVYYTPDKFDAANLFTMTDNVKIDRTEEDLLFQVMLEHDVPLSATIKKEQIAGKNVFIVADGHLIATFDKAINESTVTAIAKRKPNFFIMRDASAANDNVLDNFEQLFRQYSPDTICKIL
ncbi:MAG: site-specific DNA-methyltransferase [Muribaculaceae bacterium]|nr:site-specific DNA-methyltransferase [Muribaculaceae bacterium]